MALSLARFSQSARLVKASENNPPLRQGETNSGAQALRRVIDDIITNTLLPALSLDSPPTRRQPSDSHVAMSLF